MKKNTPTDEEVKQDIRLMDEEITRRLEQEKYRYYEPTGKGEEFIQKVGSNEHFITLYSAANGVGKCLPLNTPILMADGTYKNLEDVKEGDFVIGHDYNGNGKAEPTKVIGTSRAGIKDVYKITLKDGDVVYASGEHSFPVKLRSGRKSVVKKRRIDELVNRTYKNIGGKIKLQQPKETEFVDSGKELLIDPYFLGILLGDGGFTSGGIKFTNIDKEIIDYIDNTVSKVYGCKLTKDKITYRIVQKTRITNEKGYPLNKLVEDIKSLGLYKLKSGDKFIPQEYKTSSIENRKKLLAGLIDSDGAYKEFTSKSQKLADDFCFVARSLGGCAIKKTKKIKYKGNEKLYYKVYWNFDYELPILLKRKQKKVKKPVEYSNRFVEKIEFYDRMECGDIWVKHESHTFLSHNFISTGNTATGASLLANIFWKTDNPYFKGLPIFDEFPYRKRGRIISDPTNVEKNIIPELKYWFPHPSLNMYTTKKGNKTYESIWETNTGHYFDVMTYEQDPGEFEGVTLGWCIEENERVLMSDGRWVKIKDVGLLEKVKNTNNSGYKMEGKVVGKHYMGEKECVRVKVRGGQSITCTADHKLWVSNRREWIEAGKLTTDDRLYSPQFEIEWKNTIEEDTAFLLGVWIGDGWFDKSVFVASANDILTEEILSRCDSMKNKQRYDYRLIAPKLRKTIIEYGLKDKKSGTKFIPEVFFNEYNASLALLRGMYATDGWFSGGKVGYGTTSNKLANDLLLLLKNHGIKAGIYKKKKQDDKWNDQWFVLITQKDNVIKFCDLVKVASKKQEQEKTLHEALRRKGLTLGKERQKRDTRRSVISVTPVGKRRVYDLSIEGDHSFIVNGMRVSNCWFDEPPPERIFKATVARMRRGGIIFITATPLAGSAYLYDMFATGDYKVEMSGNDGTKMIYHRKIGYVEADIWSASKEYGIRGHLDTQDVLNIIAEYSEDERQARIYGKFQHLVGLVFKQWSRAVHVIEPFDVSYRDYAVYEMLDPHPRNPDAVQWIAIDRQGTKYVVDELYRTVESDDELARKIKQKAQQYRIVKRIADPSAFNKNQHDLEGKSLADKLADKGLVYEQGTKQRTAADRRIAEALQYREVQGQMVKPPEYYVFSDCQRTIYEFEHYQWDEWKGKTGEDRMPKEKPKDKDDHMIENTGRCLILEPTFIPYEQSNYRASRQPEPELDPFD